MDRSLDFLLIFLTEFMVLMKAKHCEGSDPCMLCAGIPPVHEGLGNVYRLSVTRNQSWSA